MGLITTQLLNEGSGMKPCKSSIVSSLKNADSLRESQISLYMNENPLFETKTEEGRAGRNSELITLSTNAVLTDT